MLDLIERQSQAAPYAPCLRKTPSSHEGNRYNQSQELLSQFDI